ncbi:TonB-dependent receptor [candidate division KSB1 bacterium]|nr:TonB-dependent receptor [candidate division KSB1 bacterium]
MRPINRLFAGIIILCVGMKSFVLMGGTTGKIAGRVIDGDTENPLIGANVVVVGTTYGSATDMNGYYNILRLPPGVYSVRTMMMGYVPVEVRQIHVSVDKTSRVDFELSPTVMSGETVSIVAKKPMVQRDLTSTEAVVGADAISKLPVDRIEDVINLQAGVVDGHMRGGRSGEVMYMIDGIPVNDVYSGESAIEVENNSVAELQVISGTFNAEYGQAMSGVVNIVTKEGGDDYHGEFSTYLGDYVSTHSDIFYNIDNINPTYNVQGSLSGPVPFMNKRLKFFASGRYYDSDGYIYGKKVFVPSDHSDWTADDPEDWDIMAQGNAHSFTESLADSLIDNADAVPMNSSQRVTLQSKITLKLTNADIINYEYFLQRNDYCEYVHNFFLNPDGNYKRKRRGYNHRLGWTHVFSSRTFMDLRFSHFYNKYNQYVLEDPYDEDYVTIQRLQDTGANAFTSGGMELWHFNRSTTTSLVKFDLISQVTNTHQFKLGLEARRHELWLHEFIVVTELPDRIPPITTFANNEYTHNPMEFSAFIQDKMEYQDIIVNAGLRFDWFNPDGEIPLDFTDPGDSEKEEVVSKSQLSPRVGIAYPISERGAIHISYGHFFQIPNFDYLYTNPEFDIYPLQSIASSPPHSQLNTVGNANLKPQKTVIYEIGLQQQLTDDVGFDLTVYYKDIRNLLGTEVFKTNEGYRYGRYINRDYANVRGITVALEKRPAMGISATLDYTFQIAMGNASDPNSAFLDQQTDPPKQTEKKMAPLNWDRRHQVNLTLSMGKPGGYNVSVIGQLGTGLPYTPSHQNYQTGVENSARKPTVYNVDLYAYKDFKVGIFDMTLFLRAYNLLDRLNEKDVFSDTGRAGYSLAPLYTGGLRPRGLNRLDDYFNRPDFYSSPREVNIGVKFKF